jgi:hypothetical protein
MELSSAGTKSQSYACPVLEARPREIEDDAECALAVHC